MKAAPEAVWERNKADNVPRTGGKQQAFVSKGGDTFDGDGGGCCFRSRRFRRRCLPLLLSLSLSLFLLYLSPSLARIAFLQFRPLFRLLTEKQNNAKKILNVVLKVKEMRDFPFL